MGILDDLQNAGSRIIEIETEKYAQDRLQQNATPEAPNVLPPSVASAPTILDNIKASPVPYIIGGVLILGVTIWALRPKAA